jgi:cytochrome c oxidase assembly protein subunit 11
LWSLNYVIIFSKLLWTQAGIYFNKIQCFCFEEQRLLAGEKIDMPVFFYIDPEFAADPKMNGVNNLILSYTFFKVEEESQQAEV